MIYMSDAKFQAQMKKERERNLSRERKRLLREERMKYFPRFNKPPTSKIALWAGFLLMLEIIIYCQYLAIKTYDTAPLVGVIAGIGGWMSMFFSYNKKSTKENSKDGIIFETAMLAHQNANNTVSEQAMG